MTTLSDGTLDVLTGPDLRQGLEDIAAKVPTCGGAKFRARQLNLCGFNGFVNDAMQLRPIQEADAVIGANRLLIPANDIAALIASFRAAAAGTAVVTVPAATMGLLYLAWEQIQTGKSVPPVLNIPSSVQTTATPTSSACPESTAQVSIWRP